METRKEGEGDAQNLESGRALRPPRGVKASPSAGATPSSLSPCARTAPGLSAHCCPETALCLDRLIWKVLVYTRGFLGNFDPTGYRHKHSAQQGCKPALRAERVPAPPPPHPDSITHLPQLLQPIPLDNLSPLPENTPTLSPLVFLESEATPIGLWNFFPHRSSQNGFREL